MFQTLVLQFLHIWMEIPWGKSTNWHEKCPSVQVIWNNGNVYAGKTTRQYKFLTDKKNGIGIFANGWWKSLPLPLFGGQ